MLGVEERSKKVARDVGIRLALIYAVLAGLWIAFSDRVLVALNLPRATFDFIASVKGELFVVVTATALYGFVVRYLQKLYSSEERYHRLFEHSIEGLTLFRVERTEEGLIADIVVEDINSTQAVRLNSPRRLVLGTRMTMQSVDERTRAYFELVREAIDEGRAKRGGIVIGENEAEELLVAYPIEDDLYVLSSMDITALRKAERALRHQEDWIREAYVDVLDAVTGGKLVLINEAELQASLGEQLLEMHQITDPSQLSRARHEVQAAIAERFPLLAESPDLLNPLGEALNNVLKHAGSGVYAVYLKDGRVQLLISDDGPGIDFRTLPKATLVPGFSTASTLGMGFTIMLQLCDRVLISTRPGHTSVVLEIAPERVGFMAADAVLTANAGYGS